MNGVQFTPDMDLTNMPEGFYDHVVNEIAPPKQKLDVVLRQKDVDGVLARRLREEREAAAAAKRKALEDEDENIAKQQRIRELVKFIASVFLTGDLGPDQKLDFEEFKGSFPARLRDQHRVDEMRQVFDMADGDGSGCISRDEYFFWMLRWMASSGQASGLQLNFQRFDASGDGELNEREWSMASDRFGFGEIGHQVFKELDADRTGTVSYKELIAKLNQDRSKISRHCQQLLTAMAFFTGAADVEGEQRKMIFDTTQWRAQDIDTVRRTIRDRVMEQLATPIELWQALCTSVGADRKLTNAQFVEAMCIVLGYECKTPWEQEVCQCVYDEMDDDKSDDVSFDEFLNWINCRRQRRRRARLLNLKWRPRDEKPLHKIVWSPDVLRWEMQSMLRRGEVSTLDLIAAHDQSEDGALEQDEFLAMMRAIVGDEIAWKECGAERASQRLFELIAGEDERVDIEELEAWFIKGKVAEETTKPRGTREDRRSGEGDPKKTQRRGSSKSMPSLVQRQATSNGRRGNRIAKGSEPDVEERSAEGLLGGSGLAARWMLRDATFEDVLSIRANEQIRIVPGANRSVVRQRGAPIGWIVPGGSSPGRSDPSWKPLGFISGRRSTSMTAIKPSSDGAPHYLTATRAQGRFRSLNDLSDKGAAGVRDRRKMDHKELYRRAKDLYVSPARRPPVSPRF